MLTSVVLWGSYINGFLCGLYGFLYLKCEWMLSVIAQR